MSFGQKLIFNCTIPSIDKSKQKIVFDSLQNKKTLAWSKLKAFAEDKIDIVKMMITLLSRVENTVGKGENADYQHFLLFPQCFPRPSSLES